MRARVTTWCCVVALCAWARGAAADDNPQSESCPFPSAPSAGTARPADDSASEAQSSSDEGDVGAGDVVGGILAAAAAGSGSSGSLAGEIEFPEWPARFGARIDGGIGSFDWTHEDFAASDDFVVAGSSLRLGRVDLGGGELAIEFAPLENVRLTLGAGLYHPIGGEDGGVLESGGPFGVYARATDLVVMTVFGEAGVVGRIGDGDLVPFVVMHGGVAHASIDVSSFCGCDGTLTSSRIVLGPRAGLRAYVTRDAFVQGAVLADLTRFPDWVATLGVGLARRPR